MKYIKFIVLSIVLVTLTACGREVEYELEYDQNNLSVEVGSTLTLSSLVRLNIIDSEDVGVCEFQNTPDYNIVGDYTVTCYIDEENSFDFNVAVVDTTAPVLTYTNESTITMKVGRDISPLDYVEGSDNYTSESNLVITYDETVDLTVVGTHVIEYFIEDEAGNQNTLSVTFDIIEWDYPIIETDSSNEEYHSFDVNVSVIEKDFEVKQIDIKLFDGLEQIAIYQFVNFDRTTINGGDSLIELTKQFTGLDSEMIYVAKVYVTYFNDVIEDTTIEEVLFVNTSAYITPSIGIEQGTQDYSTVEVDLTINDPDSMLKEILVELFDGETLVHDELISDLTMNTTQLFDNLLSNHTYHVVYTYTYDLLDGNGDVIELVETDITTLTYTAPTQSISVSEIDEQGFSVTTETINSDLLPIQTKVEIFIDDVLVNTILSTGNDTVVFENLLSNTEYTVKVTYTYNLLDGQGTQTVVLTDSAHTDIIPAPYINITSVLSSGTFYTVEFEIIDPFDTLTAPGSIKTYNRETNTLLDTSSIYLNLTSMTIDTLNISSLLEFDMFVSYDLNDGNGIHHNVKVIDKEQVDLRSVDINAIYPSQSYSYQNDTLMVTLTLINIANNHSVEEVIIDGTHYELTYQGLNLYTFYMNVPSDVHGITTFTIDSFVYADTNTLQESTESQEINVDFSVDVIAPIDVSNLSINNPVEYFTPSSPYQLMMDILNPGDYTITEIIIDGVTMDANDFTIMDGVLYINHITSTTLGMNYKTLEKICYESNGVIFEMDVNKEYRYYVANDITPINITNETDFTSMTGDGIYFLQNDITITSLSDTLVFNGYFDGSGNTITLNASTIDFDNTNIGLFSELSETSFIKDLTLNGTLTFTDLVFTHSDTDDRNIGLLAGKASGVIEGIMIDGTITIETTTVNEYSIGGLAGDFRGKLCDATIDVTAQVETASTTLLVGGISGYGTNFDLVQVKVTSNLDATSDNQELYLGGVFGESLNGTINELEVHSTISGNTISSGAIGGIIGKGNNLSLSDFIVSGTLQINSTYTTAFYTGGVIGMDINSAVSNGIVDEVINALNTHLIIHIGGLAGSSTSGTYTNVLVNIDIQKAKNDGTHWFTVPTGTFTASNVKIVETSRYYIANNSITVYSSGPYTVLSTVLANEVFYTDTLLLSDTLWDYSQLSNGYYPQLSGIMYKELITR